MNGAVVWITGLPSSGKSTLAMELFARLRAQHRPAVVLDGDEVRDVLVPRPGYTPIDRETFYATLGRLAAVLARQGLIVLVPATAHQRRWRQAARVLAPRFVEIYLDVSPAECRRRDAKGLYSRAATGAVSGLPGGDVAYEPPDAPEIVLREGVQDLDDVVQRL